MKNMGKINGIYEKNCTPAYDSYNFEGQASLYEYTGNIEAANERLIKWLAEVAPEGKMEINALLERLDEREERRAARHTPKP